LKDHEYGLNIPVHVTIQSCYEDSSVEWVFIEISANIRPNTTVAYVLILNQTSPNVTRTKHHLADKISNPHREISTQSLVGRNYLKVPTGDSEELISV